MNRVPKLSDYIEIAAADFLRETGSVELDARWIAEFFQDSGVAEAYPRLDLVAFSVLTEKSDLVFTDRELHELTGRKVRRLQIEKLRSMLIPFHVNAFGRPVVTRAAGIGMLQAKQEAAPKGWAPRVGDPRDVDRLSISTYRPACARRKARAGRSGTTSARASSLMARAHGFRSVRAFRMPCAPMPSRSRR